MSEIKKWINIVENAMPVFPTGDNKTEVIGRDATVMVDPAVGGGVARFMHKTANGAIVDIKGVPQELDSNDFSLPARDYEDPYKKANSWDHVSTEPVTPGTQRSRPEFHSGDMIKIANVYGSIIGPGIGTFVAYGTTGQDCIVLFDGKEIVVPVEQLEACLEQQAKDQFDQTDNDGNLSPMSFGSENVKVEPEDHKDQFSKWMAAVEESMSAGSVANECDTEEKCGCHQWHCHLCFPDELESSINDIKFDELNIREKKHQYPNRFGGDHSPMTYGGDALGGVEENTKTKTKSDLDFDFDVDDILSPKSLPADVNQPSGTDSDDDSAGHGRFDLPTAGRDRTQQATSNINPDATMRDYLGRINPIAGADEPELEPTVADELVVRTANDVPAVIGSAMQAAGTVSPEWHTLDNLPGYQNRNIRGLGRSMFRTITRTPQEQIKTIANVQGQGPNTNREIQSVAAWLQANAEDLGPVDVDFGMAIPGYRPEVREYRAHGIRFHMVRDPMGNYIYAYPDADALVGGNQARLNNRGTRRLREDKMDVNFKPTLLEQAEFDIELSTVFLYESTLSRLIGKQPGGQNLVKWLHRRNKLSNEAELVPAPYNKRIFWTQFKNNPDNFVIVAARDGVAGIKPDRSYIMKKAAEMAKKGKPYNPGKDWTLPYHVVAFKDSGEQVDPELLRIPGDGDDTYRDPRDPTIMNARMGLHTGKDKQNPDNVFELLQNQIGQILTVYISGFDNELDGRSSGSVERGKMQKRSDAKKPSITYEQAIEHVSRRILPVLKTLANQSLLQINRRAQRYIEGGNFEGAQKIAAAGKKLKDLLVSLDTSGDVNLTFGPVSDAFKKALLDASGAASYLSDEFKDYVIDLSQSNNAALGPVLDSLRARLVRLADV